MLPPDVTEAEFLALVDRIARLLTRRVGLLGYHDADDISQLCHVYALEALPRFREEKGRLEGFLFRHIANRLSNEHRRLFTRRDPPCRTCYAAEYHGGPGHDDGQACPEFQKWATRQRRKVAVTRPLSIDVVSEADLSRRRLAPAADEVADSELSRLIDTRLAPELRADYLKMRDGTGVVPGQRRERVQRAVAAILDGLGVPLPPGYERPPMLVRHGVLQDIEDRLPPSLREAYRRLQEGRDEEVTPAEQEQLWRAVDALLDRQEACEQGKDDEEEVA